MLRFVFFYSRVHWSRLLEKLHFSISAYPSPSNITSRQKETVRVYKLTTIISFNTTFKRCLNKTEFTTLHLRVSYEGMRTCAETIYYNTITYIIINIDQ